MRFNRTQVNKMIQEATAERERQFNQSTGDLLRRIRRHSRTMFLLGTLFGTASTCLVYFLGKESGVNFFDVVQEWANRKAKTLLDSPEKVTTN